MSRIFYPTKHLIEKLQARNITWAEVVEVCENPEVVYGPDIQGRRNLQKGDLCVVLSADDSVITVLLRDAEQWGDDQAQSRNYPNHPSVRCENKYPHEFHFYYSADTKLYCPGVA